MAYLLGEVLKELVTPCTAHVVNEPFNEPLSITDLPALTPHNKRSELEVPNMLACVRRSELAQERP
eukprot:1571217-Alexandrium_andersonii.AAC.1